MIKLVRSRTICMGVAVLAAALACAAHAGSFNVKPLRLYLQPGASSASLLLENTGDEPVVVQAELLSWSQKNGEEVLEPNQDLIVSPPVFTVAPGAAQTVRVGMLRTSEPAQELAYRLYLQEVPRPRDKEDAGIAVTIRLSMPVFVNPRGKVAPQLNWRVAPMPNGMVVVTLSNSGNAHVQTIDCRLYDAKDVLVAESNLGGYVLPGQTRSWTIDTRRQWNGGPMKLVANTDFGEMSTQIVSE